MHVSLFIVGAIVGQLRTAAPWIVQPTSIPSKFAGAGVTTVMPAGVDPVDEWWFGSDPTNWHYASKAPDTCTAATTAVTNQSPFCPTGTSVGLGCTEMWSICNAQTGCTSAIQFSTTAFQPAAGSFSVCAGVDTQTNYGLAIGSTWTGTGWYYLIGSAGNWLSYPTSSRGYLKVSDGTHNHAVNGGGTPDSGVHFYCFSFTHGGTAQTYYDGGALGSPVSVADVTNLTSTNGMAIGVAYDTIGNWHSGGLSSADVQGVWYFPAALSSADISALYATWAANGLGLANPNANPPQSKAPSLAWLPSNPWVNSVDQRNPPLYYLSQSANVDATQPYLGKVWCGSGQSQAGNCLVSQVFPVASAYSAPNLAAQYFDCGAGSADTGAGNSSPTNDMTVCAVYKGHGAETTDVIEKGVKTGGSAIFWEIARDDQRVAATPVYPADMFFNVNNATSSSPGGPGGGEGPQSSGFNDWTVGCGVIYAQATVAGCDHSTGASTAVCAYQNGVRYDQTAKTSGTAPANCDCLGNTATLHTTSHTMIGADSATNSKWQGEIVGVWVWHRAETDAQMAAFAAAWMGDKSSSAPMTRLVGGNALNFSAGF